MKPILEIRDIGKQYKIAGQRTKYLSLRDQLVSGMRSFGRRKTAGPETFWALQDISFDVQPGESVGIIGRNGAGKSTLLKVLSKITPPTTGTIRARGRVASLLEVGTGFHPELTGRENIFLNGSILGLTRQEIARQFDAIVDFSGVEKFIETPLKHYSSGMQLRLAFAVAAHLEPEILVIDEVLAVGDAEFQKKCLGKMGEVAESGRTILFVSHNMGAVQQLCSRAVVLQQGRMHFMGGVEEGISSYLDSARTATSRQEWTEADAPGNKDLKIKSFHVEPLEGNQLRLDSGVVFHLSVYNYVEGENLDVTLELYDEKGTIVNHTGAAFTHNRDSQQQEYHIQGFIAPGLLNAGIYSVSLIFGINLRFLVYRAEEIAFFEVANQDRQQVYSRRKPGVLHFDYGWRVVEESEVGMSTPSVNLNNLK